MRRVFNVKRVDTLFYGMSLQANFPILHFIYVYFNYVLVHYRFFIYAERN